MSSVPPGWPPPPPPTGVPPIPVAAPIPWENRAPYGFANALVETVKLFITNPQEAFARTAQKGNLADPLLFALILSWVGAAFSSVYSLFFAAPWLRFLPSEIRDRMGISVAGHMGSMVIQLVFAPFVIAIGLFIASAILHFFLMIVGGLSASAAGYEGTFRALSYSSVADLANLIPLLGGFIAAIWKLVLVVIGLTALHRTTTGKAVAAVLIPVVLCCGCGILAAGAIVGLIAGAFHR